MALTKISTDGVKDDAVTAGKIPANAVGSSELADDAVTTAKIADGAVTDGKIGAGQISVNKLANGAVHGSKISDQAVTLDKLPHGTSSNNGKFLRANNGADPSFETVSIPAGTTINNNADNRVITGSGTANTLNGESSFTHNGSSQDTIIEGSQNTPIDLILRNTNNSQNSAVARLNIEAGDNSNTGAQLVLEQNGAYHTLESRANGSFYISNNGTTALTLDNSNNMHLSSGSFVVGTAGEGLSFQNNSGSASGSSSSLLDDYEEGTFTPTLGYRIVQNNPTYSQQEGQYTKVGNVVHIQIKVTLSNKGSGSHNVKIFGLPFPVDNSPVQNQQLTGKPIVGMDLGGDRELFCQFEGSNSTSLVLYSVAIESSANYSDLTSSNISNSLNIQFFGSYFTNS